MFVFENVPKYYFHFGVGQRKLQKMIQDNTTHLVPIRRRFT